MTPDQLTVILQAIQDLKPEMISLQFDDDFSIVTTDLEAVEQCIKYFEEKGKPTDWEARSRRLDLTIEHNERVYNELVRRYGQLPWYKKLFSDIRDIK